MVTDSNKTGLDGMRERIRRALRDLNISAREGSRRAGFNVGYVGDFLEGRSKAPEADRIIKLAEALEIPAVELFGESPAVESPSRPQPGAMIPLPEMLPVHHVKFGAVETFMAIDARPAKMIERLPSLRYVPDAYAFIVPNDLNAPRYLPGETVYLSPVETAKPGDFVFVRLASGTAGIVRFERAEGAKAFVRTISGNRATGVEIAEISAMHKIVATTTD